MDNQNFNEAVAMLDSIKACLLTNGTAKSVSCALLFAYKKQLEEVSKVCDDIIKEYKETIKA